MGWLRRAGLVAAGTALYSLFEARHYTVTERYLNAGRLAHELTVLHISDTHLYSRQRRLIAFLEDLPARLGAPPDLVVATGDFIENDTGIEPAIATLTRLEAKFGRFYVLGSHDYYQSTRPGFARYVTGARPKPTAPRADTEALERGLQEKGWTSLLNQTVTLDHPGGKIRLSGVDDPYINRHKTDHIERVHGDALALALVHAPDVVSEWALAGFDVIFGGHTHGGQVRPPGLGAIVTNCKLPAGLAHGLHRIGTSLLHISPGLSTSHFAPIRLNCQPEATLLRIRPTLTYLV
jgi:predicted MPP superfamily phosphohydrolase